MNPFKPKSRREVILIEIIQNDPTLKYLIRNAIKDDKLYEHQLRIITSAWASIFYKMRLQYKKELL